MDKSGAEVLKIHCFVDETEEINDRYKTYLAGMITGLMLNNVITRSEANSARAIIKAKWGGMHPQYKLFFN